MQILQRIQPMRQTVKHWHQQAERIAFIPTMGNLHAGHMALVERARQSANRVIVSIFVNPLQFGPQEDLANYPRTFEQDKQKLRAAGVDCIFAPESTELFPQGLAQQAMVDVPDLADRYCGASRPGHFRGVTTIVLKLLHIINPDVVVFGEKDFQQCCIIQRMLQDLCLPVEMLTVPTQREADGLALSSRNCYLTTVEREVAPKLYQYLQQLQQQILSGNHDYVTLQTQAKMQLQQAGFKPDYLHILDRPHLMPAQPGTQALIILAAAYLGKARLIDNIQIDKRT